MNVYGTGFNANTNSLNPSRYTYTNYLQARDVETIQDKKAKELMKDLNFYVYEPLLSKLENLDFLTADESDTSVSDMLKKANSYYTLLQQNGSISDETTWNILKQDIKTNTKNIIEKLLNQNVVKNNNALVKQLINIGNKYESDTDVPDITEDEFYACSENCFLNIIVEIYKIKLNSIKKKPDNCSDVDITPPSNPNLNKNNKNVPSFAISQSGSNNYLSISRCLPGTQGLPLPQPNDNQNIKKIGADEFNINIGFFENNNNKRDIKKDEDATSSDKEKELVKDIANIVRDLGLAKDPTSSDKIKELVKGLANLVKDLGLAKDPTSSDNEKELVKDIANIVKDLGLAKDATSSDKEKELVKGLANVVRDLGLAKDKENGEDITSIADKIKQKKGLENDGKENTKATNNEKKLDKTDAKNNEE
ncbi:hypothetical protein BDAP_000790 [Binucleata daphniae]